MARTAFECLEGFASFVCGMGPDQKPSAVGACSDGRPFVIQSNVTHFAHLLRCRNDDTCSRPNHGNATRGLLNDVNEMAQILPSETGADGELHESDSSG